MLVRSLIMITLVSMIVAPVARAFNFTPLEEPEPVAEITFLDGDGSQRSLADFQGRVVVLNLWATWCAPCKREMPDLDQLQAELGGEDLEVIALSLDRGDKVDRIQAFLDETGAEHLGLYRDPTASAGRKLNAPGLPTTLVIDRDGNEVGRTLGIAEWAGPEAITLLTAVMEK